MQNKVKLVLLSKLSMNMQVVSNHWITNILLVSLCLCYLKKTDIFLIDGIIRHDYDSYLDFDPCYGSFNYPIFVPHSIIFRLLLRFLTTGLSLVLVYLALWPAF
ncbi:Uncharacterized protein TCM_017000 [Theobroma cacao]|uniref:Uncharacterized protein n=1 Tax=Theobroma cacao TaxID=3641 RepID=A0A061ECB3_THECC|nr:Uncharacterized protein TCM_017000 [Theobroma cacao]